MPTTPGYPAAVKDFGAAKRDYLDVVYAAHPNDIQTEIVALETTLGVNPSVSTSPTGSVAYQAGYTFADVKARLDNIENGLFADTHTQYVKKTGSTVTGNIVLSSGATVTGVPTPSGNTDAVNKAYADSKGFSAAFLLMGA